MFKLFFVPILLISYTSISFAEDYLNDSLSANHTYEKSKPSSQGIDILKGWLLIGDIRAGYVKYDYGNPSPSNVNINKGHTDSDGIYTMPKISILSPKYNNFSGKATLAGATDFGINNHNNQSRDFVFDPTENNSFAILQEAYITYENSEHKILIGRKELITPMVDTDDWYMLANSFELAYYANNSIENILIGGGYFYKMSGVWDSGANGTEFHSMSDASFVSDEDKNNADNAGIFTGTFQYDDKKHHNLQVWEYYASDLYNTFFAQYDYTNKMDFFSYDLGAQFINFKEVGKLKDNSTQDNGRIIDYSIYSVRFDGEFNNGFDFATGLAKFTNGQGQNSTLGAWGGYPYFANGMIFHFFEAGSLQNASSYKAEIGYNLSKIGIKNSWIGYRYTYFDLDSNYSKSSTGQDQSSMKLNGLKYSYSSNNGAYFNATYEHVNLDNEPNTFSLRLIGGYKF